MGTVRTEIGEGIRHATGTLKSCKIMALCNARISSSFVHNKGGIYKFALCVVSLGCQFHHVSYTVHGESTALLCGANFSFLLKNVRWGCTLASVPVISGRVEGGMQGPRVLHPHVV